ncbi:MAG: general secretion pathway protein GspK [Desulfobacteraceae bacterium]|nr:general secretion pathway protein GspK [Desulfobacteraceae bacterium]
MMFFPKIFKCRTSCLSLFALARLKRSNKNGIAVVLALATMMMVVTAALELHINERNSMLDTAMMRDHLSAEEMATSGVNLAMAILIKDRLEGETDSLQEDWADAETLAALTSDIPFEQGKVELKIIDELSKIQINALVTFPEGREFNTPQLNLWQRFGGGLISAVELLEGASKLSSKESGKEPPDPLAIINSIKDWLDSGDDDAITGLNGAESDYYKSLDPPYACKNGPIDDLSELLLIKGITPELFAGTGGVSGLSQYVTVYGAEKSGDNKFTFPGKININTADAAVLSALMPPESAEFVPLLIEYREAKSGAVYTNNLTRPDWYRSVPGFAEAQVDASLITVASNFFRIESTAQIENVKVHVTAVVERFKPKDSEPWQCKVLNWKTQ